MIEGGGMGSGVDTVGQSADNRGVICLEFADETVGVVASVRGGAAGADNGDGSFWVEVGGA